MPAALFYGIVVGALAAALQYTVNTPLPPDFTLRPMRSQATLGTGDPKVPT